MLRAQERIMVRTGVAEGIVLVFGFKLEALVSS
jgi:hypothetical protein